MPISELGAYLQRQRAERNLSLDEIEAQTHIRRKYLEAIEAGDWDALPPGVYTRGLLKNYARALGISAAGVQRMYIKERPSEARLPEPRLISQPLIETPRVSTELVLGVALLVVALALIAWSVYTGLVPAMEANRAAAQATPVASAPAAARSATARARPTSRAAGTAAAAGRGVVGATVAPLPSDTPGASPGTPGSSATPAPPGSPGTPGTPGTPIAASPTAGVSPTATPRPGASPGPTAQPTLAGRALVIEVLASSDAWLLVRTDQTTQFEGFLRAGDRRRWDARQTVRLRTGNAGATDVTLNGRRLDPLGRRGEVVEREWKLLESGDIQESS